MLQDTSNSLMPGTCTIICSTRHAPCLTLLSTASPSRPKRAAMSMMRLGRNVPAGHVGAGKLRLSSRTASPGSVLKPAPRSQPGTLAGGSQQFQGAALTHPQAHPCTHLLCRYKPLSLHRRHPHVPAGTSHTWSCTAASCPSCGATASGGQLTSQHTPSAAMRWTINCHACSRAHAQEGTQGPTCTPRRSL